MDKPSILLMMAERVDLEQKRITSLNVLNFAFSLGVKMNFYTRIYTNSFLRPYFVVEKGLMSCVQIARSPA